jgi:hypothetical protein
MEHILSIVIILQNEYFSYDKEYRAWVATGKKGVLVNGVQVLMKERGITEEAAKDAIKLTMMDIEMKYVKERDACIEAGKATENVLRYCAGMEYLIAGGQVWSMSCARYHADAVNPYAELAQKIKENTDLISKDGNINWAEKLKEIKNRA